jgi:hypothetical protein
MTMVIELTDVRVMQPDHMAWGPELPNLVELRRDEDAARGE